MNNGSHVLLTKIILEKDREPLTFPIAYWSRGHLCGEIMIGRPICLNRYARSRLLDEIYEDPAKDNSFETTAIIGADPAKNLAHTQNASWLIFPLQ